AGPARTTRDSRNPGPSLGRARRKGHAAIARPRKAPHRRRSEVLDHDVPVAGRSRALDDPSVVLAHDRSATAASATLPAESDGARAVGAGSGAVDVARGRPVIAASTTLLPVVTDHVGRARPVGVDSGEADVPTAVPARGLSATVPSMTALPVAIDRVDPGRPA